MGLKVKIGFILFLFISASLVSSSSAGRAAKFVNKLAKEVGATQEDSPSFEEVEEDELIHGRLLRANMKDYGRYDPAPALVRPPFKLIPN